MFPVTNSPTVIWKLERVTYINPLRQIHYNTYLESQKIPNLYYLTTVPAKIIIRICKYEAAETSSLYDTPENQMN